jgi:hypothetical protein
MNTTITSTLEDYLSDTVQDQYDMSEECGEVTALRVYTMIMENLSINEGEENRALEAFAKENKSEVLAYIQNHLNKFEPYVDDDDDSCWASERMMLTGMALGNAGLADLY